MSDSRQQTYAAAQLREHVRGRKVDDLHYHAGLVSDDDSVELLSALATSFETLDADTLEDLPGSIEETRLYRTILKNRATDTITDAVEHGNVSQMQYAIGMVSNERDEVEGMGRLMMELSFEAAFLLVMGSPGTGKTATAINIAHAHSVFNGAAIATNIQSWDAAHYHVDSYGELMGVVEEHEGRVICVIDESDNHLTGRGTDASKAAKLAKKLKLIRKEQGDVLFIGQTKKGLHPELRQLLSLIIRKPSRKFKSKAQVYERLADSGPQDHLFDLKVRDSMFNYDTYEATSWSWTGLDEDEEDLDAGPSERDLAIKTVIRAVNRGDSYREAAELVDHGKSWVGERYREWERGEHRHLVDAPAEESA